MAFWRWYTDPYQLAAGEWLEQGFTSWLHRGRYGWKVEDLYYHDYAGLPFLATYYPPHWLSAYLGRKLPVDLAWRLYLAVMVAHFWLASIGAYILLSTHYAPWSAGFVSLTLSTMGYAVKPNSSIIYTCSWIPILLLSALMNMPVVFGTSLGLMLLAGYCPIALPMIPLGCLVWLLH